MDELPWVLLGIRTAPKEDLGASTAELVYGGPLTVPGDFVPDGTPKPASHHLEQQRRRVGDLRPVPTTAHGEKHIRTHLPDKLQKAKFVFVRRDARRAPLQTPYDGPFEVVERSNKHFTLRFGNQLDKVSIDRLKPAHVDQTHPPNVAEPPRRGRPPRPPPAQTNRPTEGPAKQESSQQTVPDRPSYAEVTTRGGRTTKVPQRYLT